MEPKKSKVEPVKAKVADVLKVMRDAGFKSHEIKRPFEAHAVIVPAGSVEVAQRGDNVNITVSVCVSGEDAYAVVDFVKSVK